MQYREAIIRNIAHWTVPPGFQGLVRSWIEQSTLWSKILLDTDERELLQNNNFLKNRHLKKRCFILATGPSINKQNLRRLKDEKCIALSNFLVHPEFDLIHPEYYCIAPYHEPITVQAWHNWIKELDSGAGNAVMFSSLADRERNQYNGAFENRQIHYLKFGAPLRTLLARGADLTHPVPGPQSVTIMALMIAIYMGFEKIYLLGCDHDWILHLGESSHFYDEDQHALNRNGYDEWFGPDLSYYCKSYVRLWKQYKSILSVARSRNISIYNATSGGLLDVFPRVNFDSLFL